MIHWFDEPYRGEDVEGFEILIHGLVVRETTEVLVVNEEGELKVYTLDRVKMDYRFDRQHGKGWISPSQQMAKERD